MNTETSNQQIDPKVFERIQKMLRLAQDGGATESEAALAMEMAQDTMRKYNLTMAEMEAAGKSQEGGDRAKNQVDGKAMYSYQQSLMKVVCDVNFCHVMVRMQTKGRRSMPIGYVIIGRQANVVSAVQMYNYLNSSIDRIVKPHLASYRETLSRWAVSFKEGVSSRLQERLRERHETALREQSVKAREANATARHPASSGTAVAIIMEDFEQKERDLNNDFRNGWEPGTTARNRAEREARWAADEAERNRREQAALRAEQERRAALTDKQRQAEDEKKRKQEQRWEQKYYRQQNAYWRKRDVGAYLQGQQEANNIGLDVQVGKADAARRIK